MNGEGVEPDPSGLERKEAPEVKRTRGSGLAAVTRTVSAVWRLTLGKKFQ